jgi:hypothetical protein
MTHNPDRQTHGPRNTRRPPRQSRLDLTPPDAHVLDLIVARTIAAAPR